MLLYLFSRKYFQISFKRIIHSSSVHASSILPTLAFLNFIRIAVMLSVPMPSSVFGARISFSICSTGEEITSLSYILFNFLSNFSTASSFVRQSQMPSQAKRMNLSSVLLSLCTMSGTHETACYAGSNDYWSLYWKSPNALLRAKFPSTLESSTVWVAALILFSSSSLSGLWSKLKGTTLEPVDSTALLSPALAQ